MPVVASVDGAARLGVLSLTGSVSAEELLQGLFDLYDDPAWRPTFALLWDVSGIRTLRVGAGDPDLAAIASAMGTQLGAGRMAWVYARAVDDLTARQLFGLVKELARERRGFLDGREARAWLTAVPMEGTARLPAPARGR